MLGRRHERAWLNSFDSLLYIMEDDRVKRRERKRKRKTVIATVGGRK